MTYNVYSKKSGVNPSLEFSFQHKDEILEIKKIKNSFLFLIKSGIFIKTGDKESFVETPNAISMDFFGNIIFVLAENGHVCWKIDIRNLEKINHFKGNIYRSISKILEKTKPVDFGIATLNERSIYLSVKDLNVIYYLSFPDMFLYAGNFRAGYSVGTSLKSSMFNQPASISCSSRDELFVLDEGNNLIRKIKSNKIDIYFGKINEKMNFKKIFYTNQGLIGLGEDVQIISENKSKVILNKKIISACEENGKLYFLEKETQ